MFRPKGTEAGTRAAAKAVQGVQAMTDEQVREEFAQLRTQESWDEGPERPSPVTAPVVLGPEESSRSTGSPAMPTQGTVTGTLASTKDPHQNVESPPEQVRRREMHAAAALKRREQNLS